MPSATAAHGVSEEQRDCTGDWSAQASDVHTRIAVRRITNLQKLVKSSIHGRVHGDPIAETEISQQLDKFLTAEAFDSLERGRRFGLLEQERYECAVRGSVSLEAQAAEPVPWESEPTVPDHDPGVASVPKADERHGGQRTLGQKLCDQSQRNACLGHIIVGRRALHVPVGQEE